MNREDFLKLIEGRLKPKRVRHSLGVEQYALKMAKLYGADETKASTAALLHDIMRSEEPENMPKLALAYGIQPDEYELQRPMVLHAKLGAAYAEKELGITDGEILQAIALHTTAAPHMSKLDKIIYISDAIEPNREYDDADRLRKLAMEDLDRCLLDVIAGSIEVMEKRKGRPAHPKSYEAYEYYKKLLQ